MAKRKKHRGSKSLRDDLNTLETLEKDLQNVRATLELFLKRVEVMSWEPYLKPRELRIPAANRRRRK